MISRFSAVDLQRRWADLGRRLSLSMNVIGSAWSEIEAAYAEPHRHYHTLAHIEAVLSGFDSHRQSFEDPDVAELALFYHDVIYDPSRQDNEVQSAARLYDRLSVHLDPTRLSRACAHIEATRHHNITEDADTNLVLDLDMSILGAQWSDYLSYAKGVYMEYAPVYGAEAYAKGRAELFLEPTLAKERIFLTDLLADFEVAAHDNLVHESALWRSRSFPVI